MRSERVDRGVDGVVAELAQKTIRRISLKQRPVRVRVRVRAFRGILIHFKENSENICRKQSKWTTLQFSNVLD